MIYYINKFESFTKNTKLHKIRVYLKLLLCDKHYTVGGITELSRPGFTSLSIKLGFKNTELG